MGAAHWFVFNNPRTGKPLPALHLPAGAWGASTLCGQVLGERNGPIPADEAAYAHQRCAKCRRRSRSVVPR